MGQGSREGGLVVTPRVTVPRHGSGTGRVLYEKLRPGPGRSAEQVLANQRARLCRAMRELAAEHGLRRVTVREVTHLAGVSTKTFYNCFANIDECFTATYTEVVMRALRSARGVAVVDDGNLRPRFEAFLCSLFEDPRAAHLVFVESRLAGSDLRESLRRTDREVERFILEELRSANGVVLSMELRRAVAAATGEVARSCLLAGAPTGIPAIARGFADWLLALREEAHCLPTRPDASRGRPGERTPTEDPRIADDRRFLLAAVARLATRDGYAGLNVPDIRRGAGVSRRRFDEHFDGVADCFLAAVDLRLTTALQRAESQAAGAGSWERAVVRVVNALCREVASDPVLRKMCLVEIISPGRAGLELREQIIARWASRFRQTAPAGRRPTEVGAVASIAAVMCMASTDAAANRPGRFRRAVPHMAFVLLSPASGPTVTARAITAELGTDATKGPPKTENI